MSRESNRKYRRSRRTRARRVLSVKKKSGKVIFG